MSLSENAILFIDDDSASTKATVQALRRHGYEFDIQIAATAEEALDAVKRFAPEAIVLDLYRRAAISSGKAAKLLGMDRIAFIQATGRMGIPSIHMSPEEFAAEVELAKSL